MSAIAIKAVGASEVDARLNAVGEDVRHAARAAQKAAAVHTALQMQAAAPVDTGDLRESFGVDVNHIEIVAPYALFVDLRTGFASTTYRSAARGALDAAALAGNRALRTGAGPESVESPFPEQGFFRDTRGRYS